MAIGDETDRIVEEEDPGPSESDSVLLQDTLNDVQVNQALIVDQQASLYEAVCASTRLRSETQFAASSG
ncbi:MAG: hypothetical protein ACLQU2_13400 [Candidatus Binataceae bacterium]